MPGLETLRIGYTLPRGSTAASVTLDGVSVADRRTRTTNRGVEVTVEAEPGEPHTVVVTAAG